MGEQGGWNCSGKWTWEEMDRLGSSSGEGPTDRSNGEYVQGKKKKTPRCLNKSTRYCH